MARLGQTPMEPLPSQRRGEGEILGEMTKFHYVNKEKYQAINILGRHQLNIIGYSNADKLF